MFSCDRQSYDLVPKPRQMAHRYGMGGSVGKELNMGRQSFSVSGRRTRLGLALLVFALAGCIGGEEEVTSTAPSPVPSSEVAEYIGKSDDFRFFAAVVTRPDGKLTAYFCDGQGKSALFEGQVTGEAFSLTSSDGAAMLEGRVSGNQASGSLQLEGQRRNFKAAKAKDIGGLYKLTYSKEGEVTGTSERGNRFDGTVKGRDLTAIISTAKDPETAFRGALSDGVEDQRNFNAYRVIIQDDGDFRGNRLLGATTLSRPNRPIISPA